LAAFLSRQVIAKRFFQIRLLLAALLALPGLVLAADEDFPEPKGIKPAVAFWMRVYLEANTDGGLLHDNELLDVVYENIRFEGADGRRKERIKDARREHWEQVVRRLALDPTPRDEAEREILQAFDRALGRRPSAADLRSAATRIRFQLGQRDKFREGLIRSGAYEDAMRDVFRRAGLPEDLAYLPHVESSFNIRAYSKYGAAGMWQFMRSTGRLYMNVDYVIDERLDPMVATVGASRLLGDNYRALNSWPLALTAYNHGRGGMLRAKSQFGDDIDRIIKNYQSRSFGFASRNFYAQFLAARKILRNYESYFGPIERDEPEAIDEVALPFYADIRDVEKYLGVSRDTVQRYNPALRPPVFQSNKRIPKGYVLRLPAGTAPAASERWLASIPNERRHGNQHESNFYRVRRGDTLQKIARKHGTSVQRLVAVNNLSRKHHIYPGEVLQIPDRGGRAPETSPGFELIATANAATPATPAIPRPKSESRQRKAPEPPLPKPTAAIQLPDPEPVAKTEVVPASDPLPEEVAVTGTEPAVAVQEKTVPQAALDAVAELAAETPSAPKVAPASPGKKPELPEDSPWRQVRGNSVVVDSLETLGHYSEWLEVPASRLRKLNGIKAGRNLRMGQRIKLDFTKVTPAEFLQRRTEYHKGIEEDFFGSYEVVRVVEHRIKSGDSIWDLCNRTYEVPAWLVQRYNPDANLGRLTPGSRLVIPVVEPLANG
jgi:membrane-bound lytic murein transglycosylase D